MRSLLLGLMFAALAVIGFASTFILGSALTKTCGVSPIVLTFLRFAISAAVLFPVLLGTQRGRRALASPRRKDWVRMAWVGPVGTMLMAWLLFSGCARVSAANSSMADALSPLMVFSVMAVRSRQIRWYEVFGVLSGFFGAVLVIQVVTKSGVTLESYSVGDVYILLSACAWGIYTVFGRDVVGRIGSSAFSAWSMLLGVVTAGLPLLFCSCLWPKDVTAWLLIAGQGLFATLMPFWAWNAAQRYLPVSLLGMSAYFIPVLVVALGILFLGEAATPLQWIGTVFIVMSAVVEIRGSKSVV